MGRPQSPPERGLVQYICCCYGNKYSTDYPGPSNPTGGPVLRRQNPLQYRDENESEQANVFGQETYPKFMHKRKAE